MPMFLATTTPLRAPTLSDEMLNPSHLVREGFGTRVGIYIFQILITVNSNN